MRTVSVIIIFCFAIFATEAFPGSLTTGRSADIDEIGTGDKQTEWLFSPMLTLPAIKLSKSDDPNVSYDTSILSGIGGGISLNHVYVDKKEKRESEQIKSDYSVGLSALVMTNESNRLDTSLALSFGMLNNNIMIGVGYDLGETTKKERHYFLLGFGVNFIDAQKRQGGSNPAVATPQ